MNNERIIELYKRYRDKVATPEEKAEFDELLSQQGTEKALKDFFDQTWNKLSKSDFSMVNIHNSAEILNDIVAMPQKKQHRIKLWPRIAATAVILITVGAGLTLYLNDLKPPTEIKSDYANDIAPGKVGATLTLANGRKIRLDDADNGEIAREAGIGVTKTADGQLVYQVKENANDEGKTNTLSTAKGETYMLILPDKSKVWLNAASSLTYATNRKGSGKRSVKLEGEAYFEVSKDRAHPFVVQTATQEVEVLGTHFNVNSYVDEAATTTTLLEGSVSVTSKNIKQILKPGQQALNTGNSIEVAEADIETVTDWRNGDFFLNRVGFRTAMRKIARWYDMEVIYDQSVPNDMESSGYISRTNQLSAVLKLIEKSGQVHFRIEGRRIYVSK